MKKTFLILCMAFAYILSYASIVDVDKDTTVIRMFATDNGAGLWGYVNRKNNSWIVPPCVHTMHLDSVILKKDETDYYFLGEVNSKKCVVNIDGDFIVPPVYDELVVLNYDEKLDYSSQKFENSYQTKEIYKRNFSHNNIGCGIVFINDNEKKYQSSFNNLHIDLYDINHATKICTTQSKFQHIEIARLFEEDGIIAYSANIWDDKRNIRQIHGLMDYNGKNLYIGQGKSDKIIRFVVNGIPIYRFSYYSDKPETVDFYGHTLSVKFDKSDKLITESAQKALDKLKKKGTRWELRGDSLKQIFSQFALRRDQPKTLTNYVDVMEESYDKCERLMQYGDNTILRHNGLYGMEYQDLGFALYCEYDTIAPIAEHKGLFAIKRAGKWGIANEYGLTAKCCYDSIRMENNGDVVLVVKPKYTLFNGITKKEACYEETINSLGYPEFSNLQELLTSNVVKKKKDDVIDNFFPLAKLGESIHRNDIMAMTYCMESYMESIRGNKQKSQLIMNLAKSYTPSIKLIEDICMQWWKPVRDAYWAEKNERLERRRARLQRFNQKLERINRVLDKAIAVMQPLAQASPTAKAKTNTYPTPMASRKTSSVTTSARSGSAANDILKRKQVLKAKQKYSYYIDLVDSYVSLASDLYARIKADKVMAYGSSERRELSEHKQKIKDYLDECVKWRKVAADNGGNITASTIENKARDILSLKE